VIVAAFTLGAIVGGFGTLGLAAGALAKARPEIDARLKKLAEDMGEDRIKRFAANLPPEVAREVVRAHASAKLDRRPVE